VPSTGELLFPSGPTITDHTQLAALTTYEAYLIQFSHLRQSMGLPSDDAPEHPGNWFTYRSFETRLPLSKILCEGLGSPALLQAPTDGVDAGPRDARRPPLVCAFCTGIKGFYRPTKLWAHLVKVHGGTELQEDLLQEVRQVASLWLAHWETTSEMVRKDGITKARLLQACEEDFGWQDVLAWNLR
jgi:hypothetical protein